MFRALLYRNKVTGWRNKFEDEKCKRGYAKAIQL